MKKITLLAAFVIQSIALQINSQDSLQNNLYLVKSGGMRVLLDLNGRLSDINNHVANYYLFGNYDFKSTNINLEANLSLNVWKYSKRINYLAVISAHNRYSYDYNKDNFDPVDKRISNILNGTIYGSVDYYFIPFKFYINGSYGESFSYRYLYDYFLSTYGEEFEFNKINIYSNIWISAGYGRLINKARITKLNNFENILLRNKIIQKSLSNTVKKKLTALIEKRNNKDYAAKYKDDNEIKFMGDVERLLLEEGVINNPLGAETVMKLYQTLTNTKFLYYPDFNGLQTQLEYQFQPLNGASSDDFITLSSTYGFSLFKNNSTILSGFVSLPLRDYSEDDKLFQFGIRNPFNNKLPLIAELYGLDNYSASFYGNSGPTRYNHLSYITGLKFNMYHSFSPHFGVQLWGQGFASKPKDLGFRNTIILGLQFDYNILSIVNFYLACDWFRENSGYRRFYSNLGTSLILY